MADLNDMIMFARVVREGGFSAAARVLGLPRSQVSRRVARLEAALDTRLLERTTRRVRLTEVGEVYYGHCRRIEEEAEHAEISVHQLLEAPRGRLRATASVTMGQSLLAPHLADFLAAYPDITLDLELTNRRVDLIEEGFDVALRVGPLDPSSLVALRVGPLKAHVYGSPDYLDRHGRPRDPDELKDHRCLAMSDSSWGDTWTLRGSGGTQRVVPLKSADSVNDLATMRRLIVGGAGLAWLPSYMTAEDEAAGRLERAVPEWVPPEGACHLVYPSRRGVTPKTRAFIEFMAARIGAQLAAV